MLLRVLTAGFAVLVSVRSVGGQSGIANVKIHYEDPIQNEHYPELLYWFFTPQSLDPHQYMRDVAHISRDTSFDFPFLTPRNGVNLFEGQESHDAVAGIVREAHKSGIRIGVQFPLQAVDSTRDPPFDQDQTAVADAESQLDANGRATVQTAIEMRSAAPKKTALLRAYIFNKTGAGEYAPATLVDVTAKVQSREVEPGTLTVTFDLGHEAAGDTAFVMATTWYKALDLFSDEYIQWVHEAIDRYRDVPLDGTALDEFGYARIPMTPVTPWRGHLAGNAFGAQFEKATGRSLTQTLFETRYAPAEHPEVRIRAMNMYWEFLRSGPLRIEQEFYRYSRQVFGPNNFAGIHNTFHNHLTNDEAWATGINWWTIPRQYGMSDEDLSLPLRMGLLVSHPGAIMYDQFYGFDLERFATKAMNDARFNARLHYHGYNDTGRWGADLSGAAFLAKINPVEQKIRLLNRFDPAAPKLQLLVVFGMPALLNWYPDETARNEFDVNGSLHIEEKVKAIWDAGYRCAVVPSDLIDNGALRLDARNHPVLNGHQFQAIVYLYPQYAKGATLAFLDRFTTHGGALMLEGDATRDFSGLLIGNRFEKIASRARVRGFDVEKVAQLGVERSPLKDVGGELEDGSVILTDLASVETKKPKEFDIDVNGHRFSGSYVGVLAIKADSRGEIEKLACGGCGGIVRDGQRLLEMRKPADLVLMSDRSGAYQAVIEGHEGENALTLRR